MRKKVMAFNAKVNAWILKRLKGVWLDPIFCAIFAIMCVASIIGARCICTGIRFTIPR